MSVDNRTEIHDCDSSTGWQGDGSPNATSLAGQFYEGTGSVQGQHSDADEESYSNDDSAGSAFSLNLTDATVYFMLKDNLNNTYANGGIQLVIQETTSDRVGYDIGGSDAPGVDIGKGFRTLKGDCNVLNNSAGGHTVYTGSEANIAFTAIDGVGYGSLHNAKAQGNVANWWFDRSTYIANGSYALTINGGTSGTPETMADVRADDLTNGWGMIGNPLGSQYVFAAPTEWGNSSATADVYFEATDEQWFWVGDNQGGRAVGATHFPMRIVGNATDTIDIKWTRVVIVNTGQRSEFTAGDANVNVMQFVGVTFDQVGDITYTTQSAGNRFANACIYNNCGQLYFNTMDMDGATVNGSTNADGALLWDANSNEANQDNIRFNSDGTGHAIHINIDTASASTFNIDGYIFDGFAGQDGTAGNRVFLITNPSDGDITINVSNSQILNQVGTGNGYSYELATGTTSSVTINNNITLTFTPLISGSDVSVFLAGTNTPIQSTDSSGTSFGASVPASTALDYKIYKPGYEVVEVFNVSFTASQNILVNQQINRNWRPDFDES